MSRAHHRASRLLPHLAGGAALTIVSSIAACSSSPNQAAPLPDAGTFVEAGKIQQGDPSDVPINGLTHDQVVAFNNGDLEFALILMDADGLGPLYTRTSCGGCHDGAARGPGLVQKMAVVLGDGFTPAGDQGFLLPFGNTEHPLVNVKTGAKTPVLPPDLDGGVDGGIDGDGGAGSVRVSIRLGPPVLGRGYLEAIADSEIERMATEEGARTDGIRGRINHVKFLSKPNPDTTQTFDTHQTGDTAIGRFGLKARIATLDEFTADALQGDMGITTPMRDVEIANPDGILDDSKPGVDITADQMNSRAMYMRLLAIPSRTPNLDAGRALFEQVTCNGCHTESLKTRADYPIAVLAGIDAPVFTDMLIHDMGETLADSVAGGNEFEAGPRDWRTLPLIGLRFSRTYLHDGRASSISDAILQHDGPGSEAANAVSLFKALSSEDQKTLLEFVGSL